MNNPKIPITLGELKTFVQSKNIFHLTLSPVIIKGSTWWEIMLKSPKTNHNHIILNKLGKRKFFKKIESAINFIENNCPLNKEICVLLNNYSDDDNSE